jgi:hypothetical protein
MAEIQSFRNGPWCLRPTGTSAPELTAAGQTYVVIMTPQVRSMIAATYVKDIGTSRAFYELLGFREHSSGRQRSRPGR